MWYVGTFITLRLNCSTHPHYWRTQLTKENVVVKASIDPRVTDSRENGEFGACRVMNMLCDKTVQRDHNRMNLDLICSCMFTLLVHPVAISVLTPWIWLWREYPGGALLRLPNKIYGVLLPTPPSIHPLHGSTGYDRWQCDCEPINYRQTNMLVFAFPTRLIGGEIWCIKYNSFCQLKADTAIPYLTTLPIHS
jgi:hypothetical protein